MGGLILAAVPDGCCLSFRARLDAGDLLSARRGEPRTICLRVLAQTRQTTSEFGCWPTNPSLCLCRVKGALSWTSQSRDGRDRGTVRVRSPRCRRGRASGRAHRYCSRKQVRCRLDAVPLVGPSCRQAVAHLERRGVRRASRRDERSVPRSAGGRPMAPKRPSELRGGMARVSTRCDGVQ
jgi:hypothetical protein